MKVRPMGKTRKVRLLGSRALWVCLLTGLFAIGIAVRPGVRASFAQSTESRADAAPAAARAATAQASASDRTAKRESDRASIDPREKQIADDAANLMKLATNLKAEVDKTTPDTMSVAVIRQAEEIEKLAHKMRAR